jgi:PAS domain-containing protein
MNDAKQHRALRRAERATRRLETSAASKSVTPVEPPVEVELHPSRVELMAILGAVAEGVTVQDVSGQLMYANDAAARLSGYVSGGAMLAPPGAEALRRFTSSMSKAIRSRRSGCLTGGCCAARRLPRLLSASASC